MREIRQSRHSAGAWARALHFERRGKGRARVWVCDELEYGNEFYQSRSLGWWVGGIPDGGGLARGVERGRLLRPECFGGGGNEFSPTSGASHSAVQPA